MWILAALPLAAQPRRAVLIDIDGVRADTLSRVFGEGRLPNLARIFGGARWFDHASTVIPSVTMAAQASIATGTPPSRHGIPGNEWYDRKAHALVSYMNATGVSCVYGFTILGGPVCSTGLGNHDLEAPTMYEAASAAGLDSVVVFNQYWKGATRPAIPTAAQARTFTGGNKLDFRVFDEQMTARAIEAIGSRGMPALLTLYFTGADTIAHTLGIAAQPDYLAGAIDPAIGRVLAAVEAADPEWKAHTLFVLTSDHGRTDIAGHPEDARLKQDLLALLPAGSQIADNGGVLYVYLNGPLPQGVEWPDAVAAARPRSPADPARAGDLILTLRAGRYAGKTEGSQHGGVYPEDLAVPIVVAGPGVAPGHSAETVSITRIARTFAEFLGFRMETADPPLPLAAPREAGTH
ncbi:MAG: alkaline phosphatase family protein [Acidobacteria bacterium]|nr:alkaline phosphatase family protein [Acidobacteriota bacterium]